MSALWSARVPVEAPSRPAEDSRYECVVVGGGITGATTAVLLARAGLRVALLEARHIGAAATGNTTAKLSVLQGTRLSTISRKQSADTVRAYVDANLEGQRWLLAFLRDKGVAHQVQTAYTYAQSADGDKTVEEELRAARRVDLPVRHIARLDVPFPARSAVALDDQAQFDPMDVLAALIADAVAHGADIYENTRVVTVRRRHGDQVLHTAQGEVRAQSVVLATGTPILDRGAFFARLHPQRSYAAAFDVSEPLAEGMYLAVDKPSRSLRTTPGESGPLLLTGGAGHTVGRARSERALVDDLIDWTTKHFPTARLRARWSAQDYTPIDELPFVGQLAPGYGDIQVATGFAKWGMTNGVAAALSMSGRILGNAPQWAPVFDPSRPKQLFGLPTAAVINSEVGFEMAKGWARTALRSLLPGGETPPEGQGVVRRHGARPVGVCTVDGAQHSVSAVCPHLFGILEWNDAERSWDCPLHGSRFSYDGALLEGPTTRSLHRPD
ncbi:MAG: FAD-dependent oxidoreductase [Gordonia sp.]|nr:FAD-dependent oxidoreductase [Gordonia sp. (in: high G+C Gram-positive bacteria)]